MAKSTAILAPSLGLYFDRPSIALPPGALQGGMNFRVRFGRLESVNLGWSPFGIQLDGPVRLIDNFFPRNAGEALLFATERDLFKYVPTGAGSVVYLTPRYEVGTAAVSAANPAVVTFGTAGVDTILAAGDKITFGTAGVTDPAAVWYTIATVDDATHATLTGPVAGAPLGAAPFTARLVFTMQTEDWWDTTVFVAEAGVSDEWIGTNGADFVLSWDGVANQAAYHPEMGFSCKAVTVYKNMAIYLNLVMSGDALQSDMINSDVGSPFLAGSTGTGLSEQFKVHNGSDDILRALPLGDDLVVYSERHVTHVEFLDDPVIFIFRQSISGFGPLSSKAIADFSDYHQFLAAGTLYRYDGVASETLDTHVWVDVLRQQDPVRKSRIFSHFVEEFGDLIWSVPLTSDTGSGDLDNPPALAYVSHYLEPKTAKNPTPYSVRALPFTAAGYYSRQAALLWSDLVLAWEEYNFRWNDQFFSLAFPLTLVGDADGTIFILNEAQTGDGAVLASFVLFGRRALGDGRMRGLLRRVYPFIETSIGNLDVTAHISDHAQGIATINHTDEFDMSLPAGKHFTSPFRRGRFLELEFGSSLGAPWLLSGYDVDVSRGGKR